MHPLLLRTHASPARSLADATVQAAAAGHIRVALALAELCPMDLPPVHPGSDADACTQLLSFIWRRCYEETLLLPSKLAGGGSLQSGLTGETGHGITAIPSQTIPSQANPSQALPAQTAAAPVQTMPLKPPPPNSPAERAIAAGAVPAGG